MKSDRLRDSIPFLLMVVIVASLLGCGTNPDKAYERIIRAIDEQDWIGGSLYAREFLNRFPEDARVLEVYNLLVNCHLRLGDWGLARSVCDEILDRFPSERVRLGVEQVLGRTYLGEGNFDRALAVFSQIVDSTAPVYFRLHAIEDAATTYEIMAQRVGAATAPEWWKAESVYSDWLALASTPEAASTIPDITQARAEILQRRAELWAKAGDFRKAAESLARIAAVTGVPDLTRAQWSHLRNVYLDVLFRGRDRKGKLTPEQKKELIEAYTQTVKDFPETDYGTWARVELCKLYKPTDPEKAEAYLAEAIKRYQKHVENPSEPEMLKFYMTKIGDAYLHVEEVDRAEKAFLELRKTFPDDQRVIAYTDIKFEAIKNFRAHPPGTPAEATGEVQTATPSTQQ